MLEEELSCNDMAFLDSVFSGADRVVLSFDWTIVVHQRPHLFATGLTAVYLPDQGWLYEIPFDLQKVPEFEELASVRRVRFSGRVRELFAERCDIFAILAPEDDGG